VVPVFEENLMTKKPMTNAEFAATNNHFRKAVELAVEAGFDFLKPTSRQASKFRRGTGIAHHFRDQAAKALAQ